MVILRQLTGKINTSHIIIGAIGLSLLMQTDQDSVTHVISSLIGETRSERGRFAKNPKQPTGLKNARQQEQCIWKQKRAKESSLTFWFAHLI